MGRTAPPFAILGPTWNLLIPTVTFISTAIFFSFFPTVRSYLLKGAPLSGSYSQSIYKYTRAFCSFFHSAHQYLVFQSSLPSSPFTPKSLVFLSVYSALHTYVIYHRERILDISIRDAVLMRQHSLICACVCVPGDLPFFQQTGTRKCLPILLPTEVRSR